MKKRYALIVCVTVCRATLFAQTGADFTIEAADDGVAIVKYNGRGGDVVIPGAIGGKRVTAIGDGAFYRRGLTSVTIPEGVSSIGMGAFEHNMRLTSITIPTSVVTIGAGAFIECGLTSVTIPEGVATIDSQAFYNCASLTTVSIPASVTAIVESFVFKGCDSLKAISVSAENQEYKDIDGVLFTKDGKTLLCYPEGGKSAYTIPEGVAVIGENAFWSCANLTSVTIPASVTTIGENAFRFCASLTSITIPASVAAVGDWAFRDCGSLKPEIKADIQKRFGNSVF